MRRSFMKSIISSLNLRLCPVNLALLANIMKIILNCILSLTQKLSFLRRKAVRSFVLPNTLKGCLKMKIPNWLRNFVSSAKSWLPTLKLAVCLVHHLMHKNTEECRKALSKLGLNLYEEELNKDGEDAPKN
ncbi:MAG: hypothetical protein [Microviridae sp.]|nr:MAG: hypothetical protein [Microviridae sp.]